MKRDLELVKEILLFFERRDNDKMIQPKQIFEGAAIDIPGYEGRLISDHIDIMYEAGLLEGYADRAKDGRLIQVYPTRLTWEGHEFISAAKNKNAWAKLKKQFKSSGTAIPFKVAQALLLKYIESEAGL